MDNQSAGATQASQRDSIDLSNDLDLFGSPPEIHSQEKPEVVNLNDPKWRYQYANTVVHPPRVDFKIDTEPYAFDEFRLETADDIAYILACAAECYPANFSKDRDLLLISLEKRDQQAAERHKKLNEITSLDMLVLGGVVEKEELDNIEVGSSIPSPSPGDVLLRKVRERHPFPDSMDLDFESGRLCVNHVPTIILEDDVRDLYNGLFSLKNYHAAMETCSEILVAKLTTLFGVTNESMDGQAFQAV